MRGVVRPPRRRQATIERSRSSSGGGGSRPISAKAERARCTTDSASPRRPCCQQRRGRPEVAQVVVGGELDGALDDPPQPVQVAPAGRLGSAQVEQVEQGQPGALALSLGPVLVAVLGQQVPPVAGDRPPGDGGGQRQVGGGQGLGAAGLDEELMDVDPHRLVEHQHVPLPDQDVAGRRPQAVEHGPQPVAPGVPADLRPDRLDGLLGVHLPTADGDVLESWASWPVPSGTGRPASVSSKRPSTASGPR